MPSTATDRAWDVPGWQLPLAQLCDSALPTGAFSHSLGLETYIDEGRVTDEASLTAWLTVLVRTQLTHADGLAARMVYEALDAGAPDRVWGVDERLAAQALPRQVRDAARTMGARMVAIARASNALPLLDDYAGRLADRRCHGHPVVAVAITAQQLGAPRGVAVAAYLYSVATSLTQIAVRAIPLGQTAGQRVLAAARAEVTDAVARIATLSPEDFGAVPPGVEIAQMRHERLRARMFMS